MCVVHRYTVERDDGQGSVFAPIDHPQLVAKAIPKDMMVPKELLVAFDGNPARAADLRFKVTSKIECRSGGGHGGAWVQGEVMGHFYRQENFPQGYAAAYQVKTTEIDAESGETVNRLIFICQDKGESIRVPSSGMKQWTTVETDPAKLRLQIDADVELNVGTKDEPDWNIGVVTQVKHTGGDIPGGYCAAYQVRMLETGELYICSRDKLAFIRATNGDGDSDDEYDSEDELLDELDESAYEHAAIGAFAKAQEARAAQQEKKRTDVAIIVMSVAEFARSQGKKKKRAGKKGARAAAAAAKALKALRVTGMEDTAEQWVVCGVYGIGGDQSAGPLFRQEATPPYIGVTGLALQVKRGEVDGKWAIETPLFFRNGEPQQPKPLCRSTTASPSPLGLVWEVRHEVEVTKALSIGEEEEEEEEGEGEKEKEMEIVWEVEPDLVVGEISMAQLSDARAKFKKITTSFSSLDYAAIEISGHRGKWKSLMGVYMWDTNVSNPVFVRKGASQMRMKDENILSEVCLPWPFLFSLPLSLPLFLSLALIRCASRWQ